MIPLGTIYTHHDFDGIGSAALMRHHFSAEAIEFTTPKRILAEPVGDRDAVLDLPFPRRCAYWFDHHEQNFDDPSFHGIPPAEQPGRRQPSPSCARVILDWYTDQGLTVPDHVPEQVAAIDQFDSMLFHSLADWLTVTPAKVVNDSLDQPGESPHCRDRYFRYLVQLLSDHPLAVCAADPEVQRRYQATLAANEKNRILLRKIGRFDPRDTGRRTLILDFTNLKYVPAMDTKLALVDFPDSDYMISIYPCFERGVKTNALSVSASRNFTRRDGNHAVDLGEFFVSRDIGGGHRDAAGARLEARNRAERDRNLDSLISDLLKQIQQAGAQS